MRDRDKIREKKKRKRARIRKEIDGLKVGGCSICGYSKCLTALCFHHVGGGKDKEISKIQSSLNMAIKEMNKCILVCSNCHAEIHMKEKLGEILTEKQSLRSPNIAQLSLWSQ